MSKRDIYSARSIYIYSPRASSNCSCTPACACAAGSRGPRPCGMLCPCMGRGQMCVFIGPTFGVISSIPNCNGRGQRRGRGQLQPPPCTCACHDAFNIHVNNNKIILLSQCVSIMFERIGLSSSNFLKYNNYYTQIVYIKFCLP